MKKSRCFRNIASENFPCQNYPPKNSSIWFIHPLNLHLILSILRNSPFQLFLTPIRTALRQATPSAVKAETTLWWVSKQDMITSPSSFMTTTPDAERLFGKSNAPSKLILTNSRRGYL
ncbi:Contactin-associated protein like 5-2 [Gossypium arboreum]|uniref:Contactin-associated protein like 5-2 n=1 Tax=Gossypium arboreum TaxID=29729 RepID=A0A0B0P0M7_GOSAR|nr:Contactin-associated protein like 5-2 [Gossypium arboreum]